MTEKPKAVKLTLAFPYKIRRIRNGEKVLYSDKLGDLHAEIVDASPVKSSLVALNKLLDEAEKEIRRARRKARLEAKVCNPIGHPTDGGKT